MSRGNATPGSAHTRRLGLTCVAASTLPQSDVFERYDENGDGKLSKEEMYCGIHLDLLLGQLFLAIDANGNGQCEAREAAEFAAGHPLIMESMGELGMRLEAAIAADKTFTRAEFLAEFNPRPCRAAEGWLTGTMKLQGMALPQFDDVAVALFTETLLNAVSKAQSQKGLRGYTVIVTAAHHADQESFHVDYELRPAAGQPVTDLVEAATKALGSGGAKKIAKALNNALKSLSLSVAVEVLQAPAVVAAQHHHHQHHHHHHQQHPEDAPAGDAPPEDAPAEDAPAEDAPAEDAPLEDEAQQQRQRRRQRKDRETRDQWKKPEETAVVKSGSQSGCPCM